MLKRLLMPMLAAVIIVAMVVPGCGPAVDDDEFALTLSSGPGGSVLTAEGGDLFEGTFVYDKGDVVPVYADANAGWTFDKWEGQTAGLQEGATVADNSVLMNANYVLVALFEPDVTPPPTGWEPVELSLVIRNEDERLGMGDYFGDLAEELRFKTNRLYRTGAEAAPIWQSTAQAFAGAWHMYTGGWVSTLVSRDESGDFIWFYGGIWGWGPYGAQEPTAEFYGIMEKLYNVDLDYKGLTGLDAREALFEDVLFLAGEDSSTVHAVTVEGFNPWHKTVNVAPDLSAGVYGSRYWGYTIHTREGVAAGAPADPIVPDGSVEIKIAMPSIVTNPWNPIDGSNWVYDMMPIRAAGDAALLPHPITGFWLPQRIDSAKVYIQEDLPMIDPDPVYTADWLELERQAEITVTDDVWVDWDVALKNFITAGEKRDSLSPYYDEDWDAARGTASRKSVVVYEAGLFDDVKWHDGSPISVADFVMMMIYPYERGRATGLFHDPLRYGGAYNSWWTNFRGVEIVSTSPLTIASYSELWTLDPDWSVTTWWPFYAQGSAAWHNLALGIMAEADGTGAFSLRKSQANETEWINYVFGTIDTGGPPLLATYLATAIVDPAELPYYATYSDIYTDFVLGDFALEATARLTNLDDYYDPAGVTGPNNFWLGTGPYYIQEVSRAVNQVQMLRSPYFLDDGGKWLEFCGEPVGTVPAHQGGWVDQIDFSQVSQGAALFELNPGNIHLYAFSISDAELFNDILPDLPNIRWAISFGSWSEYLFNPVPVFDDGRVNPMGDPQIREAMQWGINRDFIADEIYGGLASPKFSLLTDVFPEAADRYSDIMDDLRFYYRWQPAKAVDIIFERMEDLGFRLYFDTGTARALWHYDTNG